MRVAITSPERLFLEGLVAIFSTNRCDVVTADTDCRQCILSAKERQADLVVCDVRGDVGDALPFVLGAQTFGGFRTIVITRENQAMPEGFEVGVDCSRSADYLVSTAREITADLVRQPTRGRRRTVTHGLELTEREYDVARLIAKGYINPKIAEELGLKEQSVKNLVSVIIRKLGCENRVQVALRLAQSAGLNPV